MHSMCVELMLPALQRARPSSEKRVLDVGSGSGYLAAVLSRLMGNEGRVYGVEHLPELVEVSLQNLKADDPTLLDRVHIQQGDGYARPTSKPPPPPPPPPSPASMSRLPSGR